MARRTRRVRRTRQTRRIRRSRRVSRRTRRTRKNTRRVSRKGGKKVRRSRRTRRTRKVGGIFGIGKKPTVPLQKTPLTEEEKYFAEEEAMEEAKYIAEREAVHQAKAKAYLAVLNEMDEEKDQAEFDKEWAKKQMKGKRDKVEMNTISWDDFVDTFDKEEKEKKELMAEIKAKSAELRKFSIRERFYVADALTPDA